MMSCCLFILLLVVLCSGYHWSSHGCHDEMSLTDFLVTIATRETSIIIVYDDYFEYTSHVLETMTCHSQRLLMYEYRQFNTFIGRHMLTILENDHSPEFRRNLNFLVMCGEECIKNMFLYVTSLDNTIGQGSLMRHFSTWFVLSHDLPPHLSINLDNVAVAMITKEMHLSPGPKSNKPERHTKIKLGFGEETKMIAYTLLWMPGGRNWSRVHTRDLSSDQLYISLFPNTQRGLNGRQLVLSMLEYPPYSRRHVINGKVLYNGAGPDVIDILGKYFNFSSMVVEPEDMSWGQELDTGNWSGIIGMVMRHEADMSAVAYGISPQRKAILDFSLVYTTEVSAIYKQHTKSHWLYFLSCFSWQVVLCGSSSLLWMFLLFWYINKQRQICRITSDKRNISNYLEFAIYIPLHQAVITLPEVTSVKILNCSWCIFCLIMTAIYTGNLVAYATVNKYRYPFTTLNELAEQDEYEIGVFEETYVHDMLKISDDETYKTIYRKLTPIKTSNATYQDLVDHSLNRLDQDKFLLMDVEYMTNYIMARTCDVVEMKEKLLPVHGGFIYPRNSPLKKFFDIRLKQLKDLGIIDKVLWDWSLKPMICAASEHSPKFSLKNLSPILVTCGTGILLAVVALIFEKGKKNKVPHTE